ncbi:hypothetical protein ACFLUF_03340, partial [Chloroflexota bacterium]
MRKIQIVVGFLLVVILLVLGACASAEEKEAATEEEVTIKAPPGPPGYQYDDYFPIALSLSDNYGNVVKKSEANGYSGPAEYSSSKTETILKPGDELHLTVEAYEPQLRELLYYWNSDDLRFNRFFSYPEEGGGRKWVTDTEITYEITAEDRESAGDSLVITVFVKSEKERLKNVHHVTDDKIILEYI